MSARTAKGHKKNHSPSSTTFLPLSPKTVQPTLRSPLFWAIWLNFQMLPQSHHSKTDNLPRVEILRRTRDWSYMPLNNWSSKDIWAVTTQTTGLSWKAPGRVPENVPFGKWLKYKLFSYSYATSAQQIKNRTQSQRAILSFLTGQNLEGLGKKRPTT